MIEKAQKSNDVHKTIQYLAQGHPNDPDDQIRELFDINGNKIEVEKGWEIADMFEAHDTRIYNPETDDLSDEELHKIAQEIIEERSKQAGKKLGAVYAIHQRPDGSNKHVHIVFLGEQKSLEISGKGKDWINKLDEIEYKYTKDEKEREKVIERNKKRIDTLTSKPTGTQKIDNFIWRHLNKENGNFNFQQLAINIEKSKMSDKSKEYYLKRASQRLRGLEDLGIAKNLDGDKWQIDIEKYQQEIDRLEQQNELNKYFHETAHSRIKDVKIRLKEINTKKSLLYGENNLNFQRMKNKLELHKSNTSIQIEQNSKTLEQLRIEETEIKLEMLENKLLQYGKIDPTKALVRILAYKEIDPSISQNLVDAIQKNVELQVSHLEALVSKGLVEREGSGYKLAVSREEFYLYLNSSGANRLRGKKATKFIRTGATKNISRKIGREVDKMVNRNTRISVDGFFYDMKRAYYLMRSLDRRSVAWNMLSFATAITWATGKVITKATFRMAYEMTKLTLKTSFAVAKEFKEMHNRRKTDIAFRKEKEEYLSSLSERIYGEYGIKVNDKKELSQLLDKINKPNHLVRNNFSEFLENLKDKNLSFKGYDDFLNSYIDTLNNKVDRLIDRTKSGKEISLDEIKSLGLNTKDLITYKKEHQGESYEMVRIDSLKNLLDGKLNETVSYAIYNNSPKYFESLARKLQNEYGLEINNAEDLSKHFDKIGKPNEIREQFATKIEETIVINKKLKGDDEFVNKYIDSLNNRLDSLFEKIVSGRELDIEQIRKAGIDTEGLKTYEKVYDVDYIINSKENREKLEAFRGALNLDKDESQRYDYLLQKLDDDNLKARDLDYFINSIAENKISLSDCQVQPKNVPPTQSENAPLFYKDLSSPKRTPAFLFCLSL
ncbi:hypothetical protein RZR97_02690 [Hydrogenimonas thermophila]|uniref:hypothetical protein n=1 Tax=Hydrogenimonas thermophila TaxID=223786 RepID=UPI00293745FD|nr:hypothetical protein [Hydrogenimonas thermophila]WOE70487.1 hypothetical protein RZR91_02705 [Hydrogenimonas thermophila]WOE73004.1 hypothetical protein RZR97_02690 [Hydrogenimonas thermophila]